MKITFKPLCAADFPLLLKWLEASHVKAWWDQDIKYDLDLVKEKFGKHVHGTPISNASNKLIYAYVVHVDDVPIGYIQAYNALSFAEDNGLDTTLIPSLSAGTDVFIGEHPFLGRGLGAQILESFWNDLLSPHFDCCLVDPNPNNNRAIGAYKKAGFNIIEKASNTGLTWMIREKSKNPSLTSVISTKTAPHFLWGTNCDGWWLKQNGRFTVISEIIPKGASEIKHFHRETEQFFYVLEGVLSIELDGINHNVTKNESISIMPGITHKVFNQSDQNVTFLVISCPDSHEDRVNLEE